jgi:hypothetical protein
MVDDVVDAKLLGEPAGDDWIGMFSTCPETKGGYQRKG